jgi:hypothetical protein
MRLPVHAHARAPGTISALALCLAVAGCGDAPGIAGHIETRDERMKRQEAEFNASPDIKGEELRRRLNTLGINDAWIKSALNENGVEISELRVPKADFAVLDHRALAKLKLDSRYRFEFLDPEQIHTAALYHGAELHEREKAKALKELAERGQLDSYPKYQKGMPVSLFVPKLEAWCGYRKGQALRVIDGNWVDYQHEMVNMAVTDNDGRATASFDCMKRVVDASTEFRRRFIGNRGHEGAIDY